MRSERPGIRIDDHPVGRVGISMGIRPCVAEHAGESWRMGVLVHLGCASQSSPWGVERSGKARLWTFKMSGFKIRCLQVRNWHCSGFRELYLDYDAKVNGSR
jgi:hypothetical protein